MASPFWKILIPPLKTPGVAKPVAYAKAPAIAAAPGTEAEPTEQNAWRQTGARGALMAAKAIIARSGTLTGIDCKTVAAELQGLAPNDATVSLVFKELPERTRDSLAIAMGERFGPEGVARLPRAARREVLRALREGVVDAEDQQMYRKLEPAVRRADLDESMAELSSEAYRSGLRQRYASPPPGIPGLTIGGKVIALEGGTRAGAQPEIEAMYAKLFDAPAEPMFGAGEVGAAMTAPLTLNLKTGKPTRLEGVTLLRPGLGNSIPSASSLFRTARYAEKLVLMGTVTDGSEGARLRRLTEYRGVPVPEGVNIFVIGRLDRAYQGATPGTDIFLEQLEEIRRDGPKLGLDISLNPAAGDKPLNVIAHSQGNVEVAMARLRLAAAGFPDAISRHVAIAPAFRGSMLSDDGPGKLFSQSIMQGRSKSTAVDELDPDALWSRMPDFLQKSVDLTFHGSSDTKTAPRFQIGLDAALISAAKHWVGEGTDGLVDLQSARFVRDPRPVSEGGRLVVASKAYDHYTAFHDWQAIDELMQHLPPVDPEGTAVLRQVAQP